MENKALERDGFADYMKIVLIWLVILGHFIQQWQTFEGYGGLYSFIYTFHVPLFVFISGYFSKNVSNYRRKNIDSILYPFVVFQLLFVLYFVATPAKGSEHSIFYPFHQNWYLIALFWWRSFIPYCQFFKRSWVIILSFIICLGVGFTSEWNGFLGSYKTAFFLPFFVIGYYCEDLESLISKLFRLQWVWVTIFGLSLVLMLVMSFNNTTMYLINLLVKSHSGYGGNMLVFGVRAFSLLVSVIMCLSALVVLKILYNRTKSNKVVTIMGGGQCWHI